MKLLLDTRIILWWLDDNSKLSREAVKLISSPNNAIIVSAVSIWEMRIKEQLGKLGLPKNLLAALEQQRFEHLPVTVKDADEISRLPVIHSDPFDRMLIAQAITSKLTIVTHDKVFSKYPTQVKLI